MEDLADRLVSDGYPLTTASHFKNGLLRGAHMVAASITRAHAHHAAVVDIYSGRAFLWGEGVCLALQMAKKPYLLVLRGGNLPVFAGRWPNRVRRLLNSAAVVVTPSRFLFEKMKTYRDDLQLLPNPLDIRAYEFKERIQPKPAMVWLRSFHEIYNPTLAPKVLAIVMKDFSAATLTMVGRDKDGSLHDTKAVAAALAVENCLHLPGGVPKSSVPQWMNTGDIFLNTTNIDNMPISVLEAMACGLCVVSTNVGGIPYLLENEHDALLVPPDDAGAMADAVRRLLTDRDLARRLSLNARRKAENFDWSNIFPEWKRLLETIVKRQLPAFA